MQDIFIIGAAEGCYQIKINHSKTKHMGIGEWITSPKFRVGQHDWVIMYYPQGSKDNNGKYVSVYLKLLRDSVDVRATFKIYLLNKEGSRSIKKKFTKHKFTSRQPAFGFKNFFDRAKLEEMYVKDCYIVLSVKIAVEDESCSQALWNTSSIGFLHVCLQKFREENNHTDVSFDVDGKIFVAHRLILAAHSPVFEAELFGSMTESNLNCIKISEMMPSVFKAMIDFMYNGSLSINKKSIDCEELMSSTVFLQHLLVTADRYAMDNLKAKCEYELVEHISFDTVLSILELAEKHSCIELKKHCLLFLVDKSNSISLLFSEEYIKLMQMYPCLLAELKNLAGK